MGFIYQIENKINNKKYIGMTTRDIETREREHINTYNNKKSRMYNFKIYKAMRKYGIENFEFSIIEECANEDLEEKERHYINLYNTVIDGYNEALGGSGKPLLTDKQIEACVILYKNGWLLEDISDVFKSSPRTISKKLRDMYNIDTKKNSNTHNSKEIIGIKDEDELEFKSLTEAANYIIENKISKSNSLICVIAKISDAASNNKHSAYGYKWKYKDAL